jgi:hypothetical protein
VEAQAAVAIRAALATHLLAVAAETWVANYVACSLEWVIVAAAADAMLAASSRVCSLALEANVAVDAAAVAVVDVAAEKSAACSLACSTEARTIVVLAADISAKLLGMSTEPMECKAAFLVAVQFQWPCQWKLQSWDAHKVVTVPFQLCQPKLDHK